MNIFFSLYLSLTLFFAFFCSQVLIFGILQYLIEKGWGQLAIKLWYLRFPPRNEAPVGWPRSKILVVSKGYRRELLKIRNIEELWAQIDLAGS